MDVRAFLIRHAPFDELDAASMDRVVASVQIEHFAPGVPILQEAGAPARFLYVIRRGGVELIDEGRVIDLLTEGEIFGLWSILGAANPTATVRAAEDTLCYLIDAEVATDVLRSGAGIAFVAEAARRRLAQAQASRYEGSDPGQYRSVGALVRRPPVTCDPSLPVAEAARLMAKERVSSLLVPGSDGGLGIITDRDLRTRIVAERRSGDTPVSEVMTAQAETVPHDAMGGEVLLRMLEAGVHHFPVAGPDGGVLGVVTDTDLMGVGRDTPFAVKSAIERASDTAQVSAALLELPRVVTALVDASADPVDIGHVVGFAIDSATRRLLKLATARWGEPESKWAWLALGSAARHEQALRTDQDHALAFEGVDPVSERLASIASFVVEALEAGGIARCTADVMATNPALRLPLDAWLQRFEASMSEEIPHGSDQLSILLDLRRVAGPLDAEPPLHEVIQRAPRYPRFVRQLAGRALDPRPPTGFVRDLVVEAQGNHVGTLNLKDGGILIIGNLARAYAIGAGVTASRTIDRLRGAEAVGAIDARTREELEEAFRFLWDVRLRHHVQQLREGSPPDDFVDPQELGSVARQGLKEAFRIIARAQRRLALEFDLPMR